MKTNEIRSFEEIKTLIEKEKKESLSLFLQKDFKSELSDRWETKNKKTPLFPGISWKPVLIAGCLFLALALGSWMVYQKLTPSPFEKSVAQIEKVLSRFPMGTIISNKHAGTFEPPENLILEWRKIREEKNLNFFFSQILKHFKEV